jgi:prepilin-type N-terminal cleavage/methylation domain-containing protein
MKIQINKKRKSGFTLIEMIGVLAVIAILAALLIPKIFEAINNARVNNACISINTIKTAIADHYAKSGSLVKDASGANLTLTSGILADFDGILLREGFIDKPFAVKVSNDANVDVRLVQGLAASDAATGINAAYDLDGSTASPSTANEAGPVTAIVAEAVIPNVALADAFEISKRLDGDALSETDASTSDIEGRVKYAVTSGSTITTLHVYLTHR